MFDFTCYFRKTSLDENMRKSTVFRQAALYHADKISQEIKKLGFRQITLKHPYHLCVVDGLPSANSRAIQTLVVSANVPKFDKYLKRHSRPLHIEITELAVP